MSINDFVYTHFVLYSTDVFQLNPFPKKSLIKNLCGNKFLMCKSHPQMRLFYVFCLHKEASMTV